jgi:hypothetical protein
MKWTDNVTEWPACRICVVHCGNFIIMYDGEVRFTISFVVEYIIFEGIDSPN